MRMNERFSSKFLSKLTEKVIFKTQSTEEIDDAVKNHPGPGHVTSQLF